MVHQLPHACHIQLAKKWFGAEEGRAAPVDLGQPGEVGRVAAQTGEQAGDEGILVGRVEERVGGLLLADGGGALVGRRRRAE